MRPVGYLVAVSLVVVGIVFLVIDHLAVQHWLAIHTGTRNESDVYYGFWSGFGSDLGEYTIAAGIITGGVTAARHHNCREHGCWRLTTHTMEDPQTHVLYRQCHKHHPLIPTEHSHHGIFRNHFSKEHMDGVRTRVVTQQDPRAL